MIKPGAIFSYAFKHLFKKVNTVRYPFVKVAMPEGFRGKLAFEKDKCIGCKICMRDCPSNAIEIKKIGDKQFEATVDLSKCIYCGQCVDSCPKNALEMTDNFELADLESGKLKVVINAEPEKKP
jgi:formate hydrogenlyase subunit 6/NADH:ubiquinone oxidoreductase subunit I